MRRNEDASRGRTLVTGCAGWRVRWLRWWLFLTGRGRLRLSGLFRAPARPEFEHLRVAGGAGEIEENAADGSFAAAVCGQHPAFPLHLQRLLTEGERFLDAENLHHPLQPFEGFGFGLAESVRNRADSFFSVHGADCRAFAYRCQP